MSVFEDLIEELREENLLEDTVIGASHAAKPTVASETAAPVVESPVAATFPEPTIAAGAVDELPVATQPVFALPAPEPVVAFELPPPVVNSTPPVSEFSSDATAFELPSSASSSEFSMADFETPSMIAAFAAEDSSFVADLPAAAESPKMQFAEASKPAGGDRQYFRKRAMEEVTGLQMVEHVLSGIEREQMKVAPRPYDDLPVKLALHDFLQVSNEIESTEHAQSEFKLMQETENWYSALSHRDRNVSAAHLRRFCETTRPALSAQALIALARFYRNSPFSESVRSKFDLVLTRLFSTEIEGEQRELLLEHGEMTYQLRELYADWASIQVYSSSENDADLAELTAKFDQFGREAETTETFDELLQNEFFNRLRVFKEGCQENFFAPAVAVAAVEANIRIGNCYVELLKKAKEEHSSDSLEEKYGFLYDQTVSDATGKTFELVALLQERGQLGKAGPTEILDVSVKNEAQTVVKPTRRKSNKLFGANKFLVILTVITILVCGGLYFWAEQESAAVKPNLKVQKVNLENSEFKSFLQTARIDGENFIGITSAEWESMNSERKEEMLRKIVKAGKDKNFKKVTLINSGGHSVGFGLDDRIEVYNQ